MRLTKKKNEKARNYPSPPPPAAKRTPHYFHVDCPKNWGAVLKGLITTSACSGAAHDPATHDLMYVENNKIIGCVPRQK